MNNPKSQILGSAYSPTSQLSELPDIKKWFPSYTYQSPELDTNEELLFPVGIGGEKKGFCAKISENEIEEKCEDVTKINHSLIHDSNEKVRKDDLPIPANVEVAAYAADSLSLLSEPPDIKKWFSSYTYQSPVLDTNEELLFSVGVDDEKGLSAKSSENEGEEECEDSTKINHSVIHESKEKVISHDLPCPVDVEVPVYSDSLSLPSEPPDITNWFSSYVYNSPELDSAEFDVSLSSGYTSREDNLKELPVAKVNNNVQGCTEGSTKANRVENNNHSTAHVDGTERSSLSPKDTLFPETTSEQKNCRAELNLCNTLLDHSAVCPNIKVEELLPIKQEESVDVIRSPAKVEVPYSRRRGCTETSEETVEKKLKAAENDSSAHWISLNRKPQEQYCSNIKIEQEQHISVENQFISTKKKSRPRISKENSPVKSVHSEERKGGMLRREILKERTNFEFSSVPEVAGKWRCPQKNKPNTGPPLKQLRLEKWVQKI